MILKPLSDRLRDSSSNGIFDGISRFQFESQLIVMAALLNCF